MTTVPSVTVATTEQRLRYLPWLAAAAAADADPTKSTEQQRDLNEVGEVNVSFGQNLHSHGLETEGIGRVLCVCERKKESRVLIVKFAFHLHTLVN